MGWETVLPKGVGVLPCVGEIPKGEVARLAARIAADEFCRGRVTVLSLPLLLCNDEGEVAFVESSPVIVIDGCERKCGCHVVEKMGHKADETLVISEINKEENMENLTAEMMQVLARKVAEKIAEKVDEIIRKVAEDRKTEPIEA